MVEKPGLGAKLTLQQELQLAAAAAVDAARQAVDPAASAQSAESLTALRLSLARLLETREQDLEFSEDIEQPSFAANEG